MRAKRLDAPSMMRDSASETGQKSRQWIGEFLGGGERESACGIVVSTVSAALECRRTERNSTRILSMYSTYYSTVFYR
jgi:hypothetical protein